MACSFRGAGSPSYSLEIQWWYIRNYKEWLEKPAWTTNQVVPQEKMPKDATKISVVKVAGSNISHKLRLSSVKPSDEGTYECRVIDFSDTKARHHRVRAYLQVEPENDSALRHRKEAQPTGGRHKGGRELRRRSTDDPTDCSDSCVL
ncbi:V-set and transmembrane domain-containing protein 2-like protein-like [Scleropages formosus]|nr:V-set and transmembrane domain-containing protein 2-like protein-like [Scleropages formosus]